MSDPNVIDMANKLAEECIAIQNEIGEDRLFMQVGEKLGASSQTLEEAFLTAVRTRLAEKQARAYMAARLKEHRAKVATD